MYKEGHRSDLRSRRRKRRVVIAVCVVVVLVAVVAGVVALSYVPFLKITSVVVVGSQSVASSSITEFVESQLAGSYSTLLSKHNAFLYPKKDIEDGLLLRYPGLASAVVYAGDFHTLTVTVVERDPKALWCGSVPTQDTVCYLVDASAVVYPAPADYLGNAYTRYFGVVSTTTPKIFITPQKFQTLISLVDAIDTHLHGDRIASAYVDGHSDVHAVFESGFTLLFVLEAGDVFERFVLALSAEPFVTHGLGDFEYLDLRFGDKLYYKLK